MVASNPDAALGQVLGKRVPKTTRGRRIVKKRESQIIEEAKSALIIRGNNVKTDVANFLRELHKIRSPLSTLFMHKHSDHPFEDIGRLEKLCNKSDHSLFAFGSSSKKRPFRVIFGRLFDTKLLDMLEYNVTDYKSMSSFSGAAKKESIVGSKPLVIFQGSAFETSEQLKRTKSLLLDFFGGPRPDKVLVQGIEQVVVCSTFDTPATRGVPGGNAKESEPTVQVRRYNIRQLKSGSKMPRIELEELGPRFTLAVDRHKGPEKDRWKMAIKLPKAALPKKTKNITKDKDTLKRSGHLHKDRQDFNQIGRAHV